MKHLLNLIKPRVFLILALIFVGSLLMVLVLPSLGVDMTIVGPVSAVIGTVVVPLGILLLLAFLVVSFLKVIGVIKASEVVPKGNNKPINIKLAKTLGFLSFVTIIAGTLFSLLGMKTDELVKEKYLFENLSVGLSFAALCLVFILSTVQHDIYWLGLSKKAKLDERQIKERQEVFETSYKFSAILVLLAVVFFFANSQSVLEIVNQTAVGEFPNITNHLFLPFFNVALSVFALPLIIAAYRQK